VSDTISQRRLAAPLVLGLLVVIGALAGGALISSCWSKAVAPSAPAPTGSPNVVLPSTSISPRLQTVSPTQGESAPPASPSPPAPDGSGVTPALPTLPPGPGEPEPSIEIPPPID
jgi:hypothetical protein